MRYWVYVFELPRDECIRACRGKPCKAKSSHTRCLYVGSSYETPEKRLLAKHSHHIDRKYKIRYDLMPKHSFADRHEAERAEHALALKLRKRYTVFQA